MLGLSTSIRNGWREQRGEYIERLPIPVITNADRATLETHARVCQCAAEKRHGLVEQFDREVLRDLAPGGWTSKLPGVLQDWTTLVIRPDVAFKVMSPGVPPSIVMYCDPLMLENVIAEVTLITTGLAPQLKFTSNGSKVDSRAVFRD